MPSIVRSISFAALTDVPLPSQSGSTVASGNRPSCVRAKIQRRSQFANCGTWRSSGALRDRHVVFVAGHREEPRRRSLEHDELRRDFGDARNELRGAGAGADHGDPLVVQVDGAVPPRRVERRPGEVVDALDVGHRRPVELAGRAHERVEPVRLRLTALRRRVDEPGAVVLVPARAEHFGRVANAVGDAEPLDARAEVVEQHRLRRVVLRPVGRLRGRVAVEVVLDVDAATRVVVLEPRAPDVVVLLEHDDVDAGLAEPVRGDDARHARADDAHRDARIRTDLADRPRRPPQVGAVERELGLVERLGVVVDRRAAHELDERRRSAAVSGGCFGLPASRWRISAPAASSRASAICSGE